MSTRLSGTFLILAAAVWGSAWAAKLPFDVQALMKIVRLSDPQISPDGQWVAFTAQSVDFEQNTKPSQIWIVPASGGQPKAITHDGTHNERPRWFPDSKQLAFVSNRGGQDQVWLMKFDGSDPRQVTKLSTESGGEVISADGKKLLFTSSVYPDCPDDACNKGRIDAEKNNKVKARSYTDLLFRHWAEWQGPRRSHVFVMGADGGGLKDLTPGSRDVPPFSLGGMDGYAISPDGAEVCYTMNADAMQATSTNSDLYIVPVAGGEAKKISTSEGADNSPVYSPDGKWIGFRSQERGGYESDRWRLMVLDRSTGTTREIGDSLDRPVDEFTWSPDGARLFFVAEDRGRRGIRMTPVAGGSMAVIASGPGSVGDTGFTSDGKTMVYSEQSGSRPMELYRISSSGGKPEALTHMNDDLLGQYELNPLEELWVDAPDQAKVHSFLVKPPGFRADVKYPVLFLIHGGPEGAWGEDWTYRWNAQVFAGAGYLVVMPNPRGSLGYGQKFTEEINSDWGGRAYDDIMAVVDHVAALPYADGDRMAAAGGSYGGYMVDWMLGHTQRFKALVSHAGVFDLRSMAGATEELWFPKWEFQGMPWDNPDVYAKWSPSYYVKDFKTPTLVVTGELDYRVPYTQSLQLFTALKLQGVPAKLLEYPDEGHWILKPQNSALWYGTVLEWLGEWLKKPALGAEPKP